MTNALLIALEGIDGSGTTTQLKRLGEYLTRHGQKVLLTAEPTTLPIGILIRQILTKKISMNEASLALLFAADRLDHLACEIEPALNQGSIVLTDRYVLSSLAYQSSFLSRDWVMEINKKARIPDITIFLRVSPESAAIRLKNRPGQRERFDDLEKQRQIAATYEKLFELRHVGQLHVVNANQDVDLVTTEIQQILDLFL